MTGTPTWSYVTAPVLGYLGRGWEAQFSTWVLLTNFVRQGGWDAAKIATALGAPTGTPAAELQELASLIEFRGNVMDEALAQKDAIIPWFMGILHFSSVTHPATFLLASAAELVGFFVAMHYKALVGRPRPSRVSPELLPPIEVPGHLSFPSGHATQAALVAWTLAQVMPRAAWAVADPGWTPLCPQPTTAVPTPPTYKTDASLMPPGPLFRMAERIGRNREVLGLHYPSDSKAGRILAAATFPIFQASVPKVAPAAGGNNTSTYESLWDRARTEWQVAASPSPPIQPFPV